MELVFLMTEDMHVVIKILPVFLLKSCNFASVKWLTAPYCGWIFACSIYKTQNFCMPIIFVFWSLLQISMDINVTFKFIYFKKFCHLTKKPLSIKLQNIWSLNYLVLQYRWKPGSFSATYYHIISSSKGPSWQESKPIIIKTPQRYCRMHWEATQHRCRWCQMPACSVEFVWQPDSRTPQTVHRRFHNGRAAVQGMFVLPQNIWVTYGHHWIL
jgi:hypothetical protein